MFWTVRATPSATRRAVGRRVEGMRMRGVPGQFGVYGRHSRESVVILRNLEGLANKPLQSVRLSGRGRTAQGWRVAISSSVS